jgi:SGNH hydrolase-like domain, acetyltransferase AlgX
MKQQLPPLGVWFGKAPSIALCILAAIALTAPAIVHLSGNNTDTSHLDNRRPAPFPALPTAVDVENFDRLWLLRKRLVYYMDNVFGLRAEFLVLNAHSKMLIGLPAADNLVAGRDGWHFLKTAEDILDQYRGIKPLTAAALDAWIDTMERRQREVEAQGSAFIVLVVPDQQTVYPDYMPAWATRVGPTRLDQIVQRLAERGSQLKFIDPRAAMQAARLQGQKLYSAYEGHWTQLGAFVGYSAVMQQAARSLANIRILQASDFSVGTGTVRWIMPPVTETQPTLTIRNIQPPDGAPDVMIVGDSFVDVLKGFLDATFSSVAVRFNLYPFPSEDIRQQRPALVVYETAERFLGHR